MSAALSFENVQFSYKGSDVLHGADLGVETGAVTALMGPSGCGKSTLIGLAAGLLTPRGGTITRNYRRAALMFQDPLLLPWRTALANVGFALKADGIDAVTRTSRAADMLARVGLSGTDISKYPRQLSGGMRQRVALARALVVEPDLLLLDEPFSGLDFGLARQMLSMVRTLVEQKGVTALVVTHDAREAARFAEHVTVMSRAPARITALTSLAPRARAHNDAAVEARAEAIQKALAGPETAFA